MNILILDKARYEHIRKTSGFLRTLEILDFCVVTGAEHFQVIKNRAGATGVYPLSLSLIHI